MKRIIGIDPGGHSAKSEWAYCFHSPGCNINDPIDNLIVTGQEKKGVVGCPNLAIGLESFLKYPRKFNGVPIAMEQPIGNRTNIIASIWCDIGYIQGRFKDDIVVPVRADGWKCYLRDSGLVPTMMGNYGAKPKTNKRGKFVPSYKMILDKHFGVELTEDQWSAWGICFWGYHNIE